MNTDNSGLSRHFCRQEETGGACCHHNSQVVRQCLAVGPLGGRFITQASSRTGLKLLSLHFLGFTVETMCNYERQVTVVDLTTSFLSLLTSNTHIHTA